MDLIVDGDSNYTTTGTPDTATVVSDGPSGTDALAAHINGIARAIVELQALVGNALTVKGSTADIAVRLARSLDADGAFVKGTAFPGSPIDGQPFYRTDLNVLYIYDAGSTSWKAGSDSGDLALLDGSRDFTGDIKIKKNAPALRLKGTEGSGLDVQIKQNAGVLIFSRNTGTEAIPVWTEFMDIDPATGALTTLLARLTGTGLFKAILTHANSADRTYTLQNSSDTLVGRATTDTFTNKTFDAQGTGNSLTNVSTSAMKTATGSASGTAGAPSSLAVTMNDYSFSPATYASDGLSKSMSGYAGTDPSNTVGRFSLAILASVTTGARWRYITASDDPTIWISYDPATGKIQGTWTSDDPTPGDVPGILIEGCTSVKVKAGGLEQLTIVSTKASEAAAYIQDRKLKMENQAYRALQLLTGDAAPSTWLLENCSMGEDGLLVVERKVEAVDAIELKRTIKKTVKRKT